MVDLARAQPHDAGVEQAGDSTHHAEEPRDAVFAADVEIVRRGEDLLLVDRFALDDLLGEGVDDAFQPFDERFAVYCIRGLTAVKPQPRRPDATVRRRRARRLATAAARSRRSARLRRA